MSLGRHFNSICTVHQKYCAFSMAGILCRKAKVSQPSSSTSPQLTQTQDKRAIIAKIYAGRFMPANALGCKPCHATNKYMYVLHASRAARQRRTPRSLPRWRPPASISSFCSFTLCRTYRTQPTLTQTLGSRARHSFRAHYLTSSVVVYMYLQI